MHMSARRQPKGCLTYQVNMHVRQSRHCCLLAVDLLLMLDIALDYILVACLRQSLQQAAHWTLSLTRARLSKGVSSGGQGRLLAVTVTWPCCKGA